MIGIHPVHRRLAELHAKSLKLGGYDFLSHDEKVDLRHCLVTNHKIVRDLDELKGLSFIAYQVGDVEWQQDICKQIDELEIKMI